MNEFPKLNDIADELTLRLTNKGFEKTDSLENEVLRYRKIDKRKFQVGIEENYDDSENPDYNNIYFVFDCDWDKDVSKSMPVFPNSELMGFFFRKTGRSIYHNSMAGETRKTDMKRNVYRVQFKKGETSAKQMTEILADFIEYTHKYIITNVEMLEKTGKYNFD